MGEANRRKGVVIGLADVREFDHVVDDYSIVGLAISRKDVEQNVVGRTVSALMALTDSEQRVRRFASRLIISFNDYNNDPRELWQIKECVEFFGAVHAQWPYWLHFLCKQRDLLGFVLKMLAQHKALASAGMEKLTLELFVPMNQLYESFGIGLDENKRMTNEVVGVLEQLVSKA